MKEELKKQIIQGIGLTVISFVATALLIIFGKDIEQAAILIVGDVIFPLVTLILIIRYVTWED